MVQTEPAISEPSPSTSTRGIPVSIHPLTSSRASLTLSLLEGPHYHQWEFRASRPRWNLLPHPLLFFPFFSSRTTDEGETRGCYIVVEVLRVPRLGLGCYLPVLGPGGAPRGPEMVRIQPEVTQQDEPLGRHGGGGSFLEAGGLVPGPRREETQDGLLSFPTPTVLAGTRKRGR